MEPAIDRKNSGRIQSDASVKPIASIDEWASMLALLPFLLMRSGGVGMSALAPLSGEKRTRPPKETPAGGSEVFLTDGQVRRGGPGCLSRLACASNCWSPPPRKMFIPISTFGYPHVANPRGAPANTPHSTAQPSPDTSTHLPKSVTCPGRSIIAARAKLMSLTGRRIAK
jgi:hypothetical protein